MALEFPPERVVYDPDEGLLRFFATQGPESIECCISLAALTALAHHALRGPNGIMGTFEQHRRFIQERAEQKFHARQLEGGGKVIIGLEDLDE